MRMPCFQNPNQCLVLSTVHHIYNSIHGNSNNIHGNSHQCILHSKICYALQKFLLCEKSALWGQKAFVLRSHGFASRHTFMVIVHRVVISRGPVCLHECKVKVGRKASRRNCEARQSNHSSNVRILWRRECHTNADVYRNNIRSLTTIPNQYKTKKHNKKSFLSD